MPRPPNTTFNRRIQPGPRFETQRDSWELRLRLALRLDNGAVFTSRQCRELASALGWRPGEETS